MERSREREDKRNEKENGHNSWCSRAVYIVSLFGRCANAFASHLLKLSPKAKKRRDFEKFVFHVVCSVRE